MNVPRTELEQAHADGWADGERWVMDNWWDYAIRRTRAGRWALHVPLLRRLLLAAIRRLDRWEELT